jgi:hypothetical protein
MRKSSKTQCLVHFVRLDAVAQQMGARSKREFLADLRTLSHRERRDVADLVKKGG